MLQATDMPPIARAANSYHSWLRRDVIALVPPPTRRVLSVGCAGGVTEAELIKRGVEVVGIEMNPTAAAAAREKGLQVFEGDASDVDSQLLGRFDCLIYADVLEHIADPVAVLRRDVELLDSGGAVIVSVPNFRHYSVFWQLFVRGRVNYVDAGIMDRTHLRITTRKLIEQWFHEAGLRVERLSYSTSRRPEKLAIAATFGFAKEFAARQVLLVGRKP